MIRALFFGVYNRASDFWNFPCRVHAGCAMKTSKAAIKSRKLYSEGLGPFNLRGPLLLQTHSWRVQLLKQ